MDPAYLNSIYPIGACTAIVPEGANGLGIVILLFSVVGLILTRTYQAFFIVSVMQTIGLFGLLEIAWISPASYVFQAFQYLMPVNFILSSAKVADYQILLFGFYRLDEFRISSEDFSLIVLFLLDISLFVTIVILLCLKLHRNK